MPAKKYYKRYRIKSLLYNQDWRKRNRERILEYNREYDKKHDRFNRIERNEKSKIRIKLWRINNPAKAKIHDQVLNSNKRNSGYLSKNIIQKVYEDNIKQYGTLTCYLCEQPIEFGQDNLEHKTPISRGGKNEYANLGIAHSKCNCLKKVLTIEEWKARYVNLTA